VQNNVFREKNMFYVNKVTKPLNKANTTKYKPCKAYIHFKSTTVGQIRLLQ